MSIITLKIIELNTPIKKQKLSEGKNKTNYTSLHCLQDTHFKYKYTDRLKMSRWKTYLAKSNKQKAGMAINITRQISKPNVLPEIKENDNRVNNDKRVNSTGRDQPKCVCIP